MMYSGFAVFLVFWLFAPIPLTVLCIILYRSREELRRELAGEPKPETGTQQAGEEKQPDQKKLRPDPEQTAAASRAPASLNPINIILVIGVLFVVSAGVIFTGSAWEYLANPVRFAILSLLSVVFFSVSFLAEKKFQLAKTAAAFFVLGSVFLPVSFLAASYFSLFGPWFSLHGDGRFLIGVCSALLLLVVSVWGAIKYQSHTYGWIALTCISVTVVCAALQIEPSVESLSIALSIYSIALVLLTEIKKRVYIRWSIQTPLVIPELLELFTVLNIYASAAIALSSRGDIMVYLLTAGIFALLFLLRLFSKADGRMAGIGVFPFAACLVLWLIHLPGTDVVPSFVLAGCTMLVLTFSGLIPPAVRKMAAIASFIVLFAGTAGNIALHPDWTIQLFVSLSVLEAVLTVKLLQKDALFAWMHPLLLVLLAYGAIHLFGDSSIAVFIVAGAAICTAFLAYEFSRLHSPLSDAAFLLALLAIFFAANENHPGAGLLALTAFNLAAAGIAVKRSRVIRYLVPHYILLLFMWSHTLPGTAENQALIWYGFLALAGITCCAMSQFTSKKIGAKLMILPVRIAVWMYGALILYAGIYDASFTQFAVGIWIFVAFEIAGFFISKNERDASLPSLWTAGGSLYLGASITVYAWCRARGADTSWAALAPAVPAAFLAFFDYASRIPLMSRFPLLTRYAQNKTRNMKVTVLYLAGFFLSSTAGCLLYPDANYGAAVLCITLAGFAAGYLKGITLPFILPLILSLPVIRLLAGVHANLACIAVFALAVSTSRLLYTALFPHKNEKGSILHADCPAFLAVAASLVLAVHWQFLGLILFASACLLFVNRSKSRALDKTVLSISVIATCAALITRPFFAIPHIVETEYLLLVPLAGMLIIHRFILKNENRISRWICFAYGALCIATLAGLALIDGHIEDALIIGVASLAVLLISLKLRLRRIFILSSVTLIILGIYLSRSFLLSLAWWIYLLATGALLIAIAAIHEISRKKGAGLSEKAGALFKDWRW